MKQLFFLLLAFGLTCPYCTFAQTQTRSFVVIKQNNGSETKLPVSTIADISFETQEVVVPNKPDNPMSTDLAVDLALPSGLKWASYDLGATKVGEKGVPFAWGEVSTKNTFTNKNYNFQIYHDKVVEKDANGFETVVSEAYTEYINLGSNIGGTEYDAATYHWGNNWRMPSYENYIELKDNCLWTSVDYNGVKGYKVTGKNNNWIFLPSNTYWTSSISGIAGFESGAAYFYGLDSYSSWYYGRSNGYYIRPVNDENVKYSATITKPEVKMVKGIPMPIEYTSVPNNMAILWRSSNDNVASVDADGIVSPKNIGTTTIRGYSVKGDLLLSCNVSVVEPVMEMVDLGLSVKWATCNIGAASPEDHGAYYEWGQTKNEPLDRRNNIPTNNSELKSEGIIDDNRALTNAYDAAAQNWGGNWRMPTYNEICELKTCNWSSETRNGVYGLKITGNNGNYIFIPAADYFTKLHSYDNNKVNILCSTQNNRIYLYNSSWGNQIDYYWNYVKCPIRPVCE